LGFRCKVCCQAITSGTIKFYFTMSKSELHTFHIPVMGLGYTIDTPVKVARFGISSVVSIIQDVIIEQMRKFYSEKEGLTYVPIEKSDIDYRAKRMTSYLNLINSIINKQIEKLRMEDFSEGNEIVKYFELLPETSPIKLLYRKMTQLEEGAGKEELKSQLRLKIRAGDIDVNIMTKLDNINYDKDGQPLPVEYADAMSALRGFAKSQLNSSVVFSAGLNPRLYTYCEQFEDFFPDTEQKLKKKIILKVSDYRSALIQGKFLAKKGLWISEFRIESGLNCGGHAFPTEGILLGPILEEFRLKRTELADELFKICNDALAQKGKQVFTTRPTLNITVQGGIGTTHENNFLLEYYNMDATGWGSPFLLVPEATNVDEGTLTELSKAKKEDYFISFASPLGIPFNNFHKSSSETQRKERIAKGRPGSPCYKKYLSFNTEFTEKPICVSSREYQNNKLKQLQEKQISKERMALELEDIMAKDCLCEGLATSTLLKNNIPVEHNLTAVTICPGPNLAYFSGVFSLADMINHIYGRKNALNSLPRPHMFINEIALYIEYLTTEIKKTWEEISSKQNKYFTSFRNNLLEGIEYYKNLIPNMKQETESFLSEFNTQLTHFESVILNTKIPVAAVTG